MPPGMASDEMMTTQGAAVLFTVQLLQALAFSLRRYELSNMQYLFASYGAYVLSCES